jgi:hypothetical protein
MTRIRRLAFGTLVTAAVVAGAAVFSAWPPFRTIPEGTAVVKLSFSHGGERRCRQLSTAELAKLPPNMRRKEVCDRMRAPVYIEFEINGARAFTAALSPSGLAGDGPARVYQRFVLPAGTHDFALRLRDTARAEGFTHTARQAVTLAPGQSLAIDFAPAAGGFSFN